MTRKPRWRDRFVVWTEADTISILWLTLALGVLCAVQIALNVITGDPGDSGWYLSLGLGLGGFSVHSLVLFGRQARRAREARKDVAERR